MDPHFRDSFEAQWSKSVFFYFSVTIPPRGRPVGGGVYGFGGESRPVRVSTGIFSG